ncbi:MAG: hypothetical protein H6696_20055 [Deferribacteres bacterium]|nr:hypothetical protein [candidate division KSB1 bacterium]MCB9504224.1 hypothetical protein [Deferribacteres bacterium]
MEKQIILLLHSNDDIFTAKQLFFRADDTLEILNFKRVAQYIKFSKVNEERPLFFLTDSLEQGTELGSLLRKHSTDGMHPPIFLLEDDIDSDQLAAAFEMGVAGFIPKPLQLELNLQRLQNLFDLLQIPMHIWPHRNAPAFDEAHQDTYDANIWWELH